MRDDLLDVAEAAGVTGGPAGPEHVAVVLTWDEAPEEPEAETIHLGTLVLLMLAVLILAGVVA
ncbi:hypothetical protein LG274_02600 [Micrococcus antarcticus]|uniref:hypothetical protein n=1 Tax=Micrococcus antarcticus TaxID=86171 RepID=UPI00384F19E9